MGFKSNMKENQYTIKSSHIRWIAVFLVIFICTSTISYYLIFKSDILKNILWAGTVSIVAAVVFGLMIFFVKPINSKTQRQERALNYYNTITKLPGRMLFNDRLNQAIIGAKHKKHLVGVIILSIDNFKNISDSLGKTGGELLIKEVSKKLTLCAGEDNTTAHLNEDEFAFIFPRIMKIHDAASTANSILQCISKPITIDEQDIYITGSIGISLYPIDGNDSFSLLENAYTALDNAKINSKNGYQFYTTLLSTMVVEHTAMKNGLIKALQRDEFIVHYQPQISLKDGKIIGAEALIRWKHPALGLIIPGKFLSTAEEAGLMIPIGEWVMRTACIQNKKWQDEGLLPICMSVNVSYNQFKDEKFIESVEKILIETGMLPKYLELDIPQEVFDDFENSRIKIMELKGIGVNICIDDFGIGKMSLKNLMVLPINTIKLDRSFIMSIKNSEDKDTMAVSMISLGHSLKSRVVAIGVEDEEQLTLLKNNNCDAIQGYYFSEPVDVERFTRYMKEEWCIKNNAIYHL